MGSLTRTEKSTYLKMNGWWSHYHEDCWFESSKDNLYVEEGTGIMKGFRPESEGITLNKAYNNQKDMNIEKKIEFEKFREAWKENWYDYYRLLDIDFKAFMLMKGLTVEEYKHLNNEELWKGML